MPVQTRSQAWSGQPPDQVTSPRDFPRRPVESRQGNAVVSDFENEGSPFISLSVANGNQHAASYDIFKCGSTRCLTCPKLVQSKSFQSNITHQTFEIINHPLENLDCHSQNLIYLLTCRNCSIQYVGETTIPLHKRINIHRTAKTGCEHIIKHKECCKDSSFQIQIIEHFEGTGYLNNKIDPESRKIRLEREDFWIKKLRTVYPYGLNERTRDTHTDRPIGLMFPSIPRSRERVVRSRRNRNNHLSNNSTEDFFNNVSSILKNNLKNAYYTIRVMLNNIKKNLLKSIAASIIQNNALSNSIQIDHCFLFIIDIIDSKFYKPYSKKHKKLPKYTCLVDFHNKAIESVRLNSILKLPDVIHLLPAEMRVEDDVPMVTYKLSATVRNKIFNYKKTVEEIYINEEANLTSYSDYCQCSNSMFCDPHHHHIITGDLRLVENNKLRKLLTKGPNFREPRSTNFKVAFEKIKTAINECVEKMSNKTGYPTQIFNEWKEKIFEKVNAKIYFLKTKLKQIKTRSVLKDPEVQQCLENIHRHFVVVPIDKASNNYAFICKYYYITKLLSEVGITGPQSTTYNLTDRTAQNIISFNKKLSEKYDLTVDQKNESLPIMYWMPKLHKNPVGSRFIVASKSCSTKPLTSVVSRVFKMIFAHIESFHANSFFYSNFKKFWVVQNSFPILEKLDKINKRKNAKSLYTFDFSTLYTTIPHKLLLQVLSDIIKLVFKSNTYNRIGFSDSSTYWTKKGVGKRYFTQTRLIETVSFLIEECYFTIGNLVFKQNIGIPMGIDPAPFWANLFLHHFESKYMQLLISAGSDKAFRFHSTNRFIDDLIAINDRDEFYNSFKNIYPSQLELKLEHQGSHATFLDLDISIKDDIFVYKLFDKRDQFPFHVVRMPHECSNMPSTIFYSSIFSEFLRIARCTLLYEDFTPRASELFRRMTHQGGKSSLIRKQIKKVVVKYPSIFGKFNKSCNDIMNEITQINV